MDLANASLVWIAHESALREIMTVDVKDFARYRLPDGEALARHGVRVHSTFAPESRITLAQRAISLLTNASSCAGVEPTIW